MPNTLNQHIVSSYEDELTALAASIGQLIYFFLASRR